MPLQHLHQVGPTSRMEDTASGVVSTSRKRSTASSLSQQPTAGRNPQHGTSSSHTHRHRVKSTHHPPSALHRCCDCSNICAGFLVVMSTVLVVLTFPFSLLLSIRVVSEYERAVVLRMGQLRSGRLREPGVTFLLPCIDSLVLVDIRTRTFDIPPQRVLTKDCVTVSVDAVVYYHIYNPIMATLHIEDVDGATRLLAQTSLRNALAARNLTDALSERDNIAQEIQDILDGPTEEWGVKVERVEVKDVRIPEEMQRMMAAEAEASREAGAKLVAAEGEQRASRALVEAAQILQASPAALQLRYLQTLHSIAAENSSTIVFPLPVEMANYVKNK